MNMPKEVIENIINTQLATFKDKLAARNLQVSDETWEFARNKTTELVNYLEDSGYFAAASQVNSVKSAIELMKRSVAMTGSTMQLLQEFASMSSFDAAVAYGSVSSNNSEDAIRAYLLGDPVPFAVGILNHFKEVLTKVCDDESLINAAMAEITTAVNSELKITVH